jgi:hypothetical protein
MERTAPKNKMIGSQITDHDLLILRILILNLALTSRRVSALTSRQRGGNV